MIQRIQSIFLLLAAGGALGVFGLPFASTSQAVSESAIFADAQYNVFDNPALMALFGIGGALALVSIFLFNNRKLQMRLTIFAFIAVLIGTILGVVSFMTSSSEMGDATIQDEFGMYLPAVALLFALLAYRFINKDEKLVKSMDRLR
ncbi:MAG: DUF4293 domain-containing protein [Bacteroidota bacterium]